MNELISTKEHPDLGTEAVSARELYLGLGLMSNKWSRWVDVNILNNEYFTQGIDFIKLPLKGSANNPNPPKDFAITIEMAKHLAMMARTDKSHEYRNYFIELEKRANREIGGGTPMQISIPQQHAQLLIQSDLAIGDMLGVPKHYSLIESVKTVKRELGLDYQPLLSHSKFMQSVSPDDVLLEPTELGKLVGLSGKAMNRELMLLGLQKYRNGNWEPTELGESLAVSHSWSKGAKSGYNYKWKRDFILNMLEEKDD